jgi:hypothetical protein
VEGSPKIGLLGSEPKKKDQRADEYKKEKSLEAKVEQP